MMRKRFLRERRPHIPMSSKSDEFQLPKVVISHESENHLRRNSKRYVVPKIIISIALLLLMFPLLFGKHPLHGGYLGMIIDIRVRKYLWNRKLKAATKEALEWGLDMSRINAMSKAKTKNVPYAVILEMIHREQHRKNLLREMETDRDVHDKNVNTNIVLRQKDIWSRPIAEETGFKTLDLDHSDMDSYMKRYEEKDPHISAIYFQMERSARDEFFFISFLNRHGGLYSNPHCNQNDNQELLRLTDKINSFETDQEDGWVKVNEGVLQSLVVPPHHAFFKCIIGSVNDEVNNSNLKASTFNAIINSLSPKATGWNGDSQGFVTLPQKCPKINFETINTIKPPASPRMHTPIKEIVVQISAVNESSLEYVAKTTIDEVLTKKSRFCTGIWMWPCHRCLKSALHGSYSKCSLPCGSCSNVMYTKGEKTPNEDVVRINVNVHGYEVDGRSQIIPRIIHQTWFEDITPVNYPHLVRLQNSWKASGWSYKFYTDESARQFILDHFPTHFLDAYDALIPGAYKADLFRYMLLMKEGGIYGDIDVLLDGSLNAFVTPSLSFFAPRDCVAEYADGQYCLWNGFIGAAPGHPFIIRAVERLVNLILNRADVLDLEKEVAEKSGADTHTWKIRAVQELLLSGPCALGIAVNEVLHEDPVSRFDVGWLDYTSRDNLFDHKDLGDMLILMVSHIFFSIQWYA